MVLFLTIAVLILLYINNIDRFFVLFLYRDDILHVYKYKIPLTISKCLNKVN